MTGCDPADRPHVRLRAVTEDDLPVFYAHQRDQVACELAGFVARDRSAFFAHWKRILADPRTLVRTVLADGAVAGHVACFERDGAREVAYWIDRALWGRSIATRALAAFLREVPGEFPGETLRACVVEHNVGSRRVLEKCGFVRVAAAGDGAPSADGHVELWFELRARAGAGGG